jgi:hypothetical protein
MNALGPLWQIENELQALIDSLDVCSPEMLPELERRISEYVTAEIKKIDNIAGVLASLDAVQANAKAEIERLRARQQSAEKAAQRLEGYVLHVLRERDGRPLKGNNTTFLLRKSEALVITDPTLIPDRWKRVTVLTDYPKAEIKRALKSGESVPGVHLEQRDHLQRK